MSWMTAPLNAVAKAIGGGTPSKANDSYWDGHIPWVSPKDMTAREIHGAVDHITMEAVSSSATQLVPPGAVLVVVRSGILVRRLPIAITRVQVALNQDMKAFVCNDQVLPDFLAYFLESKESLILQNCVKKGATVHSIAMDRFTSLPVPIPAKKEQSRIVELLDEASRLRSLRREADAKAARILPALFLKMFGDPATNPKGFPKKPLGSLIKVKSGDFLPAKDMAQDGRCPVYGGNGINGYHDSYMFDDRKIVLGRVGVYCGVVHYSEPKAWITDNALYISEKFEPLDDYYLVAALEQAKLNQYAGRAGQPLISGSRIYPIEILVPPEAIQARFAKTVASLLSLDEIKTSASNRIDQLWGILMGRAFSGQLTAKWREAHLQELLAEMAQQARALNLPMPHELDASS